MSLCLPPPPPLRLNRRGGSHRPALSSTDCRQAPTRLWDEPHTEPRSSERRARAAAGAAVRVLPGTPAPLHLS